MSGEGEAESTDRDDNPYAPPRAPEPVPSPSRRARSSDFEAERRPVFLLLLLSLATLGFYPCIWFIRRQRFLDAHAAKPLGALPIAYLGVQLGAFAIGVALAFADPAGKIQNPTTIAAGVVGLLLSFRVAGILRSVIAARGLNLGVSSVAVFFFGCLYLQYKINQIADALAALPPRKKKRKRKPATDALPATDSVDGSSPE